MTSSFGNSRPEASHHISIVQPSQSQATAGFAHAQIQSQMQKVLIQGGSQNFTSIPGSLSLQFNKSYLNMETTLGVQSFDSVVLTNTGNTTVHYKWRKVQRPDFIQASHTDQIRRFYCYSPPGTLKPGQQRVFTFTFRSQKLGIFFEEWQLLPQPLIQNNPLPYLCLSGTCKGQDEFVQNRLELQQGIKNKQKERAVGEALNDMISDVHTQQHTVEDARQNFSNMFEQANKIQGLWSSEFLEQRLPSLVDQILQAVAGQNRDQILAKEAKFQGIYPSFLNKLPQNLEEFVQSFVWSGSVKQLQNLILYIYDDFTRWLLSFRLGQLISYSRNKPLEYATSFSVFTSIVQQIADILPKQQAKCREQLGLMEYVFETPPYEQLTPEQQHARDDALKAKKADFYKKKKLKPKTEEEQAKDMEDLKQKTSARILQSLVKMLDQVEGKTAGDRALQEITDNKVQNVVQMNLSQWDRISRKFGMMDADFQGKNVVIRADVDIKLVDIQSPIITDMGKITGGQQSGPSSTYQMQSAAFTSAQMDTNRSGLQQSLGGTNRNQLERPHTAELIKPKQVANSHDLDYLIPTVKYCLDRMANRIFIIGNLGPKTGTFNHQYSLRPIQSVLAKRIDQPVVFYEGGSYINNFAEKLQNDELAQNTVYIMENLNFCKQQFGFANIEQIVKQEEEEDEQQKIQNQQGNAKEKPAAQNGGGGGDEKEDQVQIAPVIKKEIKTYYASQDDISTFVKKLTTMGDIYINQAPITCSQTLRTNSLVNMSSGKKVLGFQIVQALRKLAYFFKYPTIQSRPNNGLTVVLGGGSNFLQRIKLINGLLDYNQPDVLRMEILQNEINVSRQDRHNVELSNNRIKQIFIMGRAGLQFLEIVLLELQSLKKDVKKIYPSQKESQLQSQQLTGDDEVKEKQDGTQFNKYPAGQFGWIVRDQQMEAKRLVALKVMQKAQKLGARIVLPHDFIVLQRPENLQDLIEGKIQENQERQVKKQEDLKTPQNVTPSIPRKASTLQELQTQRTEQSKLQEKQPQEQQQVIEEKKVKHPLIQFIDIQYNNRHEVNLPNSHLDPIQAYFTLLEQKEAILHAKKVSAEKFALAQKLQAEAAAAAQNEQAAKLEKNASNAKLSKVSSKKKIPEPQPVKASSSPIPPPSVDDGLPRPQQIQFQYEQGGLQQGQMVLQYGTSTITQLTQCLQQSSKIFWDGNLCCYGQSDTVGDNNKSLMQILSTLRENNSDYQNIRRRQVIMMHDSECEDYHSSTSKAYKEAAERIKQEQLSMKNTRTNSVVDGESGFDDTTFQDGGGSGGGLMSEAESKNISNYSDVAVFDKNAVKLTTAIMQGKLIPGVMDVNEHEQLSKEEIEEDLSCLQDI